jgi:ABC-2 type transport system ATP-binding protein
MIDVRDLSHAYQKPVLQGVSFRIDPGEVVGYLGPNGAGKTTTIKILCGMLEPDAGVIRVAGLDPLEEPLEVRRRIGYVPESGALYEALTPLEYLTMLGRLHGLSDERIEQRARAFLQGFGIESNLHDRMTTFSKGMKQKVVISAALLHDPDVLFLDEPLNGLDANATLTVKEIVRGLAARGRTVLYSSHLMDVVERISDRVVILDGGRVIADGSAAELRERSGDASLEGLFNRLTTSDDERGLADGFLAALSDGSRPASASSDAPSAPRADPAP